MTVNGSDLTLSEADRKELIRWTTSCVRRLLPIFEIAAPHDGRLLEALEGAESFARGEVGVGPMRKLAFACHAAARDVDDPAAEAVARACGQAVAVAHMAGHSREVARYTKRALGTESPPELAWQRAHIPARFEKYVYNDTLARPGAPE
ncbi:MAG: putative immunity protein [Ornithinimicrobium sp.]